MEQSESLTIAMLKSETGWGYTAWSREHMDGTVLYTNGTVLD